MWREKHFLNIDILQTTLFELKKPIISILAFIRTFYNFKITIKLHCTDD